MQIQVLKHILDNPEWLSKTQPEIFNNNIQLIFNVAKKMDAKGIKPTFNSIKYVLDKKEEFTAAKELAEVYSAKEIDQSHFKLARTDLRVRALQTFTQTYQALGELDAKGFKVFQERLMALNEENEPEPLQHAVSFFDWNKHKSPEGQLIGSGLRMLENTGSDFQKGQLINTVAPSGGGKTAVLRHIAKHLLTTMHNVLVLAFEETQSEYLTAVGMGLIKKTLYNYENLTSEEIEKDVMHRYKNLGNLDVITGSSIYVEDIEDKVKEEEALRGYKYDAIIIDYSRQLETRTSNKNSATHEEISVVFRKLKELAMRKDNEKVVISAIQSNRGGYGKQEVSTVNISESMGPLHASDMMLSIKRLVINPIEVSQEDEVYDMVSSMIKVTVLKKRKGTVSEGTYIYYGLQKCGNLVTLDKTESDGLWDELLAIQE